MPRARKPIKPMKYPTGHEYQYRLSLRWLNAQMRKAVKRHFNPIVPKMVAEVTDTSHPVGGHIRQDAWADELSNAMQKIGRDMQKPTDETIKRMKELGPKINKYNKEEWQKLIRSQYGVNPTSEDVEKYAKLLDGWSINNASLIKDIPEKTLVEIADLSVDALQTGKSVAEMQDDVYEMLGDRMDVQESRANLIARDQVAKLNGNLTQERQADLGVSKYRWRTVGDERVRLTHQMADGNLYSWDKPPEVTNGNHPGLDFQCRCYAEPVLPEVLAFEASLLEEAA